jgi:hypothetical protein
MLPMRHKGRLPAGMARKAETVLHAASSEAKVGQRLMGSSGGGLRQVGCRAASRPAILKIELSLCQWADESRILPDSHKSRHPPGTAQPHLRLRVPPPVGIAPVRLLATSLVQSALGAQLGLRGPRGVPTDRPAQMINIFRCKAWLREKLPSARASGALDPATECANDWIGLYNLTAC